MTIERRKRLIGRFLLKPAAGLASYCIALLAAGDLVGAYSSRSRELHGAFMFMTVMYLSLFAVLPVLAASSTDPGFLAVGTGAVTCAEGQVLIG